MADVPLNRSRIVVPIMAGRKTKPANNNSTSTYTNTTHAPPRPRTRAANKKAADAESLRLPCLDDLGLYAFPTQGDGNCLYYALSDQLYGVWDKAGEIRENLARHMKHNRQYFMSFTAAVGGRRRAPRRAASAAARSSSSSVGPSATPEEQEEAFEAMIAESEKNGVWGGSEEIQAFCQYYRRDVRVYTDAGIQVFRDVNAPLDEQRDAVHIAFHNFNHYSSVRNVDGPHTGLPCVKAIADHRGMPSKESPVIIDVASPWKISCIQEGLGGRYDHDAIVEMLRQCRGDIDRAFAKLLDEETPSSQSSAASASSTSKSIANLPGFKPRLPSSRSSSRHSTASKRSANDDSDDEPPNQGRRTRGREQKRRILPNVTVGIAFRDEEKNDLVSLRLRVGPDAIVEQAGTADAGKIDKNRAEPVVNSVEESQPVERQVESKGERPGGPPEGLPSGKKTRGRKAAKKEESPDTKSVKKGEDE